MLAHFIPFATCGLTPVVEYWSMLYIFYGEDSFSLHRAIEKIKDTLGDREMLMVNTARLDGQRLTLKELKDNCDSVPFLSSHRLVIVEGLLQRFEVKQSEPQSGKKMADKELGEWEGLALYVERMPQTAVLMLVDGEIKSDNPLLRKLSSLAKVKHFPLLRGTELREWIRKEVREKGGTITPQAVNLLAELVGGDLWAMSGEIDKLLLYCQGRSIREDDIKQMISQIQEANVFALVDAIVEGRTGLAQDTLHRLYREGVAATHILALITRQFRLMAQAKELAAALSRSEIQQRLGLRSSFSLDKALRQANLYDLELIKHAYDRLLETDLAIKTGKCKDQLAVELLISELSCLGKRD